MFRNNSSISGPTNLTSNKSINHTSKRPCFAKGTKSEKDCSKQGSVNEVEDITNNDKEDWDISVHYYVTDLEVNTDDSDF